MKNKLVINKQPSFRLLVVLGSFAFLYINALNFLGTTNSQIYYNLGLILLTLCPLIILLFIGTLNNPKLLFLSVIFVLPFIPSLSGYLNIIGGPFLVVSIEILVILGLFFSNLSTIRKTNTDQNIIFFIVLWLIGNTIPAIFSIDFFNSLPYHFLSIFTVIPWVLLLFALINSRIINKNNEYLTQAVLPVFCASVACFALSGLVLIFLNEGTDALDITSIIRPTIKGPGYITNNTISAIALIAVPIAYALLKNSIQNGKLYKTLLYLSCIVLYVYIILLDKSRAAFLVMILFLFILVFNQLSSLFLRRRHATKISFRAMIFLLFILTVFLYAFYLGLEGVLMRLSGDETNFSLSEIIFNTFISARGTALLVSWNEFLSYPLFGKGYSNNLNYIPTFGEYWNSHNMILEQLCATGIIGTFPIFYLLFQCLRAWYKSISRLNERDSLFANSILLSILGLLAFGLASGFLLINGYDLKSALPMLIFVFLVMSLFRITSLIKEP